MAMKTAAHTATATHTAAVPVWWTTGTRATDPIRMLAVAYMPAANPSSIARGETRGRQAPPPPGGAEHGQRGDEPGGHRPEHEPQVGQRGPETGQPAVRVTSRTCVALSTVMDAAPIVTQ